WLQLRHALLGKIGMKPASGIQRVDLVRSQVAEVAAAIRRLLHRRAMQDVMYPITAEVDVDLHIINAPRKALPRRRISIFRRDLVCALMTDNFDSTHTCACSIPCSISGIIERSSSGVLIR